MSTNNTIWRKPFGIILKQTFELCGLNYTDFCVQYNVEPSTFRYWRIGKRLPQSQYIVDLKKFLDCPKTNSANNLAIVYKYIESFMSSHDKTKEYQILKSRFPSGGAFIGEILEFCWNSAKGKINSNVQIDSSIAPTGKIQVVAFDFDGTLTLDRSSNRTTWESIWEALGYSSQVCPQLHQRFSNGEITHSEWCKITEDRFKEKNLHKTTVEEIASKIKLLKGVRETFETLSNQGIKIYIVSGSIDIVINKVLGDTKRYVDGMKSNYFKFNSAGFLTEIVGTKYDFEGKKNFMLELSVELKISPADILFVGNSLNDEYVRLSGAKTLCINPKLTNPHNHISWDNCILECKNLSEILNFI